MSFSFEMDEVLGLRGYPKPSDNLSRGEQGHGCAGNPYLIAFFCAMVNRRFRSSSGLEFPV